MTTTRVPSVLSALALSAALVLGAGAHVEAAPPAAPTTPGAVILQDYRAKIAPVLDKLDEMLSQQVAGITAQLLKKGDTSGAEAVTTQLKEKISGQPVERVHEAVATLFTQYDAAIVRALQPHQAAALAKIDAVLKSSASKDPAIVTELGQVQRQISDKPMLEVALVATSSDGPRDPAPGPTKQPVLPMEPTRPANFDTRSSSPNAAPSSGLETVGARFFSYSRYWTYHQNSEARVMALLTLQPDGTWTLVDCGDGSRTEGTWQEAAAKQLQLTITKGTSPNQSGQVWEVAIGGNKEAVVTRPDIGSRHLKVTSPAEAEKLAYKDASGRPTAGPGTALASASDAGTGTATLKPGIPQSWSYHAQENGPPVADMQLHADLTWSLRVRSTGNTEVGTWKLTEKADVIRLTFGNDSWDLKLAGDTAAMNRPDSGMRYLKAAGVGKL